MISSWVLQEGRMLELLRREGTTRTFSFSVSSSCCCHFSNGSPPPWQYSVLDASFLQDSKERHHHRLTECSAATLSVTLARGLGSRHMGPASMLHVLTDPRAFHSRFYGWPLLYSVRVCMCMHWLIGHVFFHSILQLKMTLFSILNGFSWRPFIFIILWLNPKQF